MPDVDVFTSAAIAASASFFICVLIVGTQEWHGKLSLDTNMSGAQKFHKVPVPRIGGLALLLGGLAAAMFVPFAASTDVNGDIEGALLRFLLAGLPAFFVGLVEDVTKKVSIAGRLTATFVSALLGCWLIEAVLLRIDVWGIDILFQRFPFIAVAFTAFAVAGVANAVNIIDGFHGIAGTTVIIILAGLGFLGWQAGDRLVVELAVVGAAAAFGFLLVNYPTGRLFLGDGGAYLAGFWTAETAILLIARNPAVSAWQALAVCSYPVIEAVYSIYRKRIIRKKSPAQPDKLHFHMLVYRRLVWRLIPRNDHHPWIRNAMVACVIAIWTVSSTVVAVLFGNTTASAVLVILMNVTFYIVAYSFLIPGRRKLKYISAAHARPENKIGMESPVREMR
jgi:UDP-N-acetylmuramyl pentapeptide phosphotransferase/UDP-N-acetylglucosamine-1-phosphate transferase